jgi:DNA-binding NarL/FixJ family response regulator
MARRRMALLARDLVEAAHQTGAVGEALVGLTDREAVVLHLMADGRMDREIAAALTISPRTVETHVSNILHKLGVRNRAEAGKRYRDGT